MKKNFKFWSAITIVMCLAACTKPENPKEPTHGGDGTKVTVDFMYEVNGMNVTFTNKSAGATLYKWDFGDGETSKEVSPTHEYLSSGEYIVKLTVANADGETASKQETINVSGQVKAYFTYIAQEGRSGKYGKILNFDATSSQNAVSILWDFGDGKSATEFKLSHEFPDFGTYDVKATVSGSDGKTDVYKAEIKVVANTELLKGGQMNEGDEQYWTIAPIWADVDGDYTGDEGTYCWTPTFGYTEDKPAGGEGGCLRLSSENQTHDFANNFLMYQAIEVEAGDVLRVSAEMKWGENNNDNGLLWFGFSKTEPLATGAADGTAIIEMYNYWGVVEEGEDRTSTCVPAFDGNFATNESWVKANAEMGLGYSGDGVTPYVEYSRRNWSIVFLYGLPQCLGINFWARSKHVF